MVMDECIPDYLNCIIMETRAFCRYDYDDPHFIEYMDIMHDNFEVVGNNGLLTVFPWLINLRYLPGTNNYIITIMKYN